MNELTEYWGWLASLEKPVRDIILSLDDEQASGRIGARQEFMGQLEYAVWALAVDEGDKGMRNFLRRMDALQARFDPATNEAQRKTEALELWNQMTYAYNLGLELAAKKAEEAFEQIRQRMKPEVR
jgi:hypothetical protein